MADYWEQARYGSLVRNGAEDIEGKSRSSHAPFNLEEIMQKQFKKPTAAALLLSLFTYAATANLDIEGVARDSVSFDPIGGVKIVLMQDTTQAVITDGLGQFHFVYPSKPNGSRLPSFPVTKAANGQRIYIFNSLGTLLGSALDEPGAARPFIGVNEMKNFGVGRYFLSNSETFIPKLANAKAA